MFFLFFFPAASLPQHPKDLALEDVGKVSGGSPVASIVVPLWGDTLWDLSLKPKTTRRSYYTHRSLSSSFLGLPYRILNITHKKELLI